MSKALFILRPLPETQWFKDGQLINPSKRVIQGNYGKSLIIKSVDFNDNGTYTCGVSNGVGTAKSYSVNLRVLGKFSILSSLLHLIKHLTAHSFIFR